MAKQQSWKTSRGRYKPKTEQHTYRFNAKLWAEFEAECGRNLRNVRLVVEALVRHWLDAGPETKQAIARHHHQRITDTLARQHEPSASVMPAPARAWEPTTDAESFEDTDLLDV